VGRITFNPLSLGSNASRYLSSPRQFPSGTIEMQEELPPYDYSPPLPGYVTAGGPTSPIDTISLLSGGEYIYKSDHLHIDLGPRRWGTKFPVYGFQDVVEGSIQVAKKCSHVVSVTATVSLLWSRSSHRPASDALGHLNS